MDKVKTLRKKCNSSISIDGGLSMDTIDTAAEAGANMIVVEVCVHTCDPYDDQQFERARGGGRSHGRHL